MNQTLVLLPATVLSALALVACSEKEPTVPLSNQARPVKTMVIQSPEAGGRRSFPGRVAAANRATLSFQVAGIINEILVKEGEEVNAGQTLARLSLIHI